MNALCRAALLFSLSSLLLACSGESAGNAAEPVAEAAAAYTARPEPVSAPLAASPPPAGPEMLSTVGLYEREPLRAVDAAHGRFAIEEVNGVATLTVGGSPVRYLPAGGSGTPVPIEANAGLDLVGVFELPGESVAWVLVTGGTACAGTHLLVPARGGRALPGQELPGCDDRGTMRRDGEHILFEAGGSTGRYADGLISVESAA